MSGAGDLRPVVLDAIAGSSGSAGDGVARHLAGVLQAIADAPRAELPAIVGVLAQAEAMALARLTTSQPAERAAELQDANIPIAEAARRLGVSRSYLYKNAKSLPFLVRIGRRILCSPNKLEKWNRARLGP